MEKNKEKFCDNCNYKHREFELRENKDGKLLCVLCREKQDSKEDESLKERVKKLEDKNKENKKEKDKQTLWNKTLMNVVFYGAVASGITAICQLIMFIMNFFKK